MNKYISSIDDERNLGNGIIVSLKPNWFFKKDRGCGVRGFDTMQEVKSGTSQSEVYFSAKRTNRFLPSTIQSPTRKSR
jgi:hypothetical protein